ncbi:MAG: hypothetical protein WDZ41_00625 [Candidatus Babeliales bacterium]
MSKLLAIFFIFLFNQPAFSMEIDPLSEINYLTHLPIDIQNHIASYLGFFELDEDFIQFMKGKNPELKELSGEKHTVSLTKDGTLEIQEKEKAENSWANWLSSFKKTGITIKCSNDILPKSSAHSISTRARDDTKEFFYFAVSRNFHSLIGIQSFLSCYMIQDQEGLYLIDIQSGKYKCMTWPQKMYPLIITAQTKDVIIEGINKGYSHGSKDKLNNFFRLCAITDNANKIALANNHQVYVLDQIGAFKIIKELPVKAVDNNYRIDDWYTHKKQFAAIDFNKQGSKLGIRYQNDEIELIDLEKWANKLAYLFYKKGVCKNLQSTTRVKW